MENSLIKFVKQNKLIFCYGAGEYAFWITLFLKIYNCNIYGYIVTKKTEQKYLNKNVYSLEEVKFNADNSNIIIGVSEQYHAEIINLLNKINKNFNVYVLNGQEVKQIVNHLISMDYKEILKAINEDISTETYYALLNMQLKNKKNNLKSLCGILNNEYRLKYQIEFNLLKDKYSFFPRYKETKINFQGKEIMVPDLASFLPIYEEILLKRIYEFKAEMNENLVILDIGANIGIASFFFSKTYPNAKIIAFEPDRKIYNALQYNMKALECKNVTIVNKAVWDKNEIIKFYSEGSDGGRIEDSLFFDKNIINVNAIDIVDIMKEYSKIDFLKMDIEGAETRVLRRAENYLCNVQNIFVEYHSKVDEKQTLDVIIDILSRCGFRVYMNTNLVANQPYIKQKGYNGFDILINIFGIKEKD